ncbi:MAG: amino acid ABC transporter permease, partial [Clostridia bacterium]|nr:amino acid ABC transporter permease [Clostridia bacterium]
MKEDIYNVLIHNDNYKHITNGLWVTIYITFFALIIGLILGFLVAIIRSTHDKTGKFGILNAICKFYLTVIRGTPVIVQLLVIYYLWLSPSGVSAELTAIIAFGVNSGAYVAEIFRSGIMSIDNGQFEAGRSLGFSYTKTMIYIIMPQAFKNVLPTLANEFIVLLKETSVASFIAVKDMMKGANALVGFTYNMNIPYLTVALIYLVLVLL